MRRIAAAVLFFSAAFAASAAQQYRFTSVVEGSYPRRLEGRVTGDDRLWRIDYAVPPGNVVDLNTIIGSGDGSLIAINDTEQTWFRLPSRKRLQIDGALFSYGTEAEASKVEVHLQRVSNAGGDASEWKVDFSYKLTLTVSSEKVRGRVWGSVEIWTTPAAMSLPWKPLDLQTPFDSFNSRFQAATASIEGTAIRTETVVNRQLEDGPVLRSVIRRSVSEIGTVDNAGVALAVPPSYVHQEPRYGAPAAGMAPRP
jgi:hypothetical protein